jgi:hypothetical protein
MQMKIKDRKGVVISYSFIAARKQEVCILKPNANSIHVPSELFTFVQKNISLNLLAKYNE